MTEHPVLMDSIILGSADIHVMSSFAGLDASNSKAWVMSRAARWKRFKEQIELCNQCWITRLIGFRSLRVSFSRGAVNISAAECEDAARCAVGILPRGLANWVARPCILLQLCLFLKRCIAHLQGSQSRGSGVI